MTSTAATSRVLASAAAQAGFDTSAAILLRDGSNVLYQLPGDVVARVGKPGTAAKEVRVAQWLAQVGLPSIRAVAGVAQPVMVEDRPVTWWESLSAHRPGTTAELGTALRALHDLTPPPTLQLPSLDPFTELDERIDRATVLGSGDRRWLVDHLSQLRARLDQLPPSDDQQGLVHGDAWQDNLAVTANGPILLDLERVSLGDQNWDLIPIAVDRTDFARLSANDYQSFVDAYGGHDVTGATAFRLLADIQELRWLTFVLSKATTRTGAEREVKHRVACLRGERARPWNWAAF